jgi:hypothetical protein
MFLTRTVDVKSISDVFNEENSEFKSFIIIDLVEGLRNNAYSEILLHTIKGVGNLDRLNLYVFISESEVSENIWKAIQLHSGNQENINTNRNHRDILALVNVEAVKRQEGNFYVFYCSQSEDEIMNNLGEIQKKIKKQESIENMKSLSTKVLGAGLPVVWEEIVKIITGGLSSSS